MPFVKMRVDAEGSQDGIKINHYIKGREYNLNLKLAKNFVKDQRIATYVAPKVEKEKKQEKMISVPENKMVNVPDNKVVDKIKNETLTVFQLADEIKISSKKIIKAAKKIGYDVDFTSILEMEQINKIKETLNVN